MKRMGYVFLAEVVLAGMLVTLAGAQSESLGDYARSVRKDDKPASAKKYDNDNLPTSDKISIVGNATESTGRGRRQRGVSLRRKLRAAPGRRHSSTRKRRTPAKTADSSTRRRRTTNGSRRLPSSRARLTCSRANWM